ncbi:MAG: hypothetical protein VE98_C0001G0378 [candidate division Kazan bacterium GW2011_GWA1_50_15]|uniref:Glycosyltransferase RgtA/B/C/D-like domain-containing protein n=2 Tax=Bacteria division Kazan-3B-28 TaxID=1798534 RepID=A0A0G1X6X9_UNCK3|nr:MAG: hypothetical protein VE98_C0001G0378 [candidate division Kazan bacterium GW2011_GWA1_50_15]KKW25930.1 MAG: hypothetical protein VE99_C0001G0571 [candidate division Kazan bacterium GW2011_GWC1_52_13]KKW26585.1 MAG: hypothetical protein VF00_C0003G0015 [candidate division Kazan bacterium GW2011_GWB1_52_7]
MSIVEWLLILPLLALSARPLVDPDFGWHLRSGMDLLKNLSVPRLDPYSYTAPHWPWVNHEWLSDGMAAFVYNIGGPFVLIALFALTVSGAFLLAASLGKLELKYKLLASVMAGLAALPILGVRMQMLTLLGMALVLWALYRFRNKEIKNLWWLIPVFWLWTNLHGGFLMGLVILAVFFVAEIIKYTSERVWPKFYRRLHIAEVGFSLPQLRHLIWVGLGSGLVTLINPYGWGLYYDFYKLFSTPFATESIAEWQPVILSNIGAQNYTIYISVLLLLLLLTYRKVEPTRWLLMGVFFYLSLLYWRNLPFFMIVSVGFLAETIYQHTHLVFDGMVRNRYTLLVITAVVASMVAQWISDVIPKTANLDATFAAGGYPINAVNWAKTNPDKLGTKMFNEYGHGGFLVWQFPEQKVFIDGRMPYWRTDNDRLVFYDEQYILNARPGAIEMMQQEYGVDWVFIRAGLPLDWALDGQADTWEKVYYDRYEVIYRKKPANAVQ